MKILSLVILDESLMYFAYLNELDFETIMRYVEWNLTYLIHLCENSSKVLMNSLIEYQLSAKHNLLRNYRK